MMIIIPEVFTKKELQDIRPLLEKAEWHDGRETAGYVAVKQKSNEQLRVQDDYAIEIGQRILAKLSADPRFVSFALPLRILSPMFNCYRNGGEYGFHIDNAIRVDPLTGQRIRTDVSTTVFFNDPDEYEGGELIINDTYGVEKVKLPAGHAVVYPGTSLHRVAPVTKGKRLASFFWTQSMIRDDAQRSILYGLDRCIQQLATRPENDAEIIGLTGTYHNLIRQWAET